jgi:hypothetical protein
VPPARIASAAKDADACAVENGLRAAGRDARRASSGCVSRARAGRALACLYWGDANADAGVVSGQIERAYVAACAARTTGFHIACARLAAAWLAAANTRDEAERHLALLRQACERSDGQAWLRAGARARERQVGRGRNPRQQPSFARRPAAWDTSRAAARPAAPQPEQR